MGSDLIVACITKKNIKITSLRVQAMRIAIRMCVQVQLMSARGQGKALSHFRWLPNLSLMSAWSSDSVNYTPEIAEDLSRWMRINNKKKLGRDHGLIL